MNPFPKIAMWLIGVYLGSAWLAWQSPAVAGEPVASRPNIVFLLSDDQTVRAAGCYGNPDVITPNLDQLASEGVRFTNHYITSAICMASRVIRLPE